MKQVAQANNKKATNFGLSVFTGRKKIIIFILNLQQNRKNAVNASRLGIYATLLASPSGDSRIIFAILLTNLGRSVSQVQTKDLK